MALNLWRMGTPFFQKLGPPKFRRWLADLAVAIIPDKKLEHMRTTIDTMYDTSTGIFAKRRAAFRKEGGEEEQDMISILRQLGSAVVTAPDPCCSEGERAGGQGGSSALQAKDCSYILGEFYFLFH